MMRRTWSHLYVGPSSHVLVLLLHEAQLSVAVCVRNLIKKIISFIKSSIELCK